MNRTRYTVTPNPHDHAPSQRFVVKRGETLIGYAPTRYKARKLAGEHAQALARANARGAGKTTGHKDWLDKAGEASRLKGWTVDGRPER